MIEPDAEPTETITTVAIQRDGVAFTVPAPGRHRDVIEKMVRHGMSTPINHGQGFLTSTGRFVDRSEAKLIARAACQLLPTASASAHLFSEDLW